MLCSEYSDFPAKIGKLFGKIDLIVFMYFFRDCHYHQHILFCIVGGGYGGGGGGGALVFGSAYPP